MSFTSVQDLDVEGKRVLVRVDFNVPLKDGQVSNDKRIQAALPTINYLLSNNAKVILCSHLGRPKGEVKPEMSLKPVAAHLSSLLNKEVTMAPDCVGQEVTSLIENMQAGSLTLLENLRFHKQETDNDPEFAQQLAANADLFVNDAFGTMHRAHASTVGVTNYLPTAAGFLVEKELNSITPILQNPQAPFVAILGGSKVTDKVGVIKNLLPKVDYLLIGGAMMFSFLKARGVDVGNSKIDDESIELAKQFDGEEKIILPVDTVAASEFAEDAQATVVDINNIPSDQMGLDIGPKTIDLFKEKLQSAKTVVWGGPMGVFEFDAFAQGTKQLALTLAELDATTLVGGGDSAAAAIKFGVEDKVTHVSTGGGATLEFLEGKILPGVQALEAKASQE